MIQVVVKAPGEDPVTKQIDDAVDSIQAEVGGYFEAHQLVIGPRVLTLYVNEDGRHKYMSPNVRCDCHGEVIVGPVLVMAGDNGLTDAQVIQATMALRARAVLAPV